MKNINEYLNIKEALSKEDAQQIETWYDELMQNIKDNGLGAIAISDEGWSMISHEQEKKDSNNLDGLSLVKEINRQTEIFERNIVKDIKNKDWNDIADACCFLIKGYCSLYTAACISSVVDGEANKSTYANSHEIDKWVTKWVKDNEKNMKIAK